MSKPTPLDRVYAWHANAMLGAMGEAETVFNEDPQCGWFKRSLVKDGPLVPARIWLEQPVDDETGDLIGDEVLRCEVNGREADPIAQWSWLCGKPIARSEFDYMMARRQFSQEWAPHEPAANPYQPVDWRKVPIPTF